MRSLRFKLGTIRGQIAALAIGPILLVGLVAGITEPFDTDESVPYAKAMALRIEMVVREVEAADTPASVATILEVVEKTGFPVELVPLPEFQVDEPSILLPGDPRKSVRHELPAKLAAVVRDTTPTGRLHDVLVVRLNDATGLAFALPPAASFSWLSDRYVHAVLKAMIVILPVMLLSFYAGRMITRPLTRFAAAAEGLDPSDGPDRPFEEQGAREIKTLARALNDMRSRVRGMIDDRTRMLRAISHDLRTPLTRLRLRAERSTQRELREAMLHDISIISGMLEETLIYLSKEVSAEKLLRADLPSLLETVCADFSDIGFSVRYQGPTRFAYSCKPRALARAVTNLVDNGTKFANNVTVKLQVGTGGAVQIEVEDDGPGLPSDLGNKVLEPFFKVDAARTTAERSGFGLGLSIVYDVVRGHGGTIALFNRKPHGLLVRLVFPAVVMVAEDASESAFSS